MGRGLYRANGNAILIIQVICCEIFRLFWPDSSLEQVSIRYDVAELIIWNCNTNCKVIVQCKGFIGMTDLCIWDDQIILQAECQNIPWPDVIHSQDTFCDPYAKRIRIPHNGMKDGSRMVWWC